MQLQDVGRLLLLTGLLLGLAGLLLMLGPRVPFLGRLPGDIHFRWGETSIFIPIMTSILLSIILSVGLNLVLRILNR